MAEGQVYVEVDASVVNGGAMPMAIVSSRPEAPEGSEDVTVWIRWRYDDSTGNGGFTGVGWYWEDENNWLRRSFESEDDFKSVLKTQKPQNLDLWLDSWPKQMKIDFFTDNMYTLWPSGCLDYA